MEPWGTPDLIVAGCVRPLALSISCCRFWMYEVNNLRAEFSNVYVESIVYKISWLTKSKALRKSRNNVPIISPLSMQAIHLSTNCINAVRQLCFDRKPDCFYVIKCTYLRNP